jgi:two-component system CheB/CheR fusion protein
VARKTKKPNAKRPRKQRSEPAKARPEPEPEPRLPIVGIGASAGGLEALEQFLRHVPQHPNCAFVLVQHLDPAHRGMLVELLARMTSLQVVEATDGARVEPEHLYVIPPGKDMSLLHGTLHLLPQVTSRGRVLPIDFFFRSLAQDQGERAIGVILSGMGSDGTLGVRAIKEAAGATFVQSPESAKFDGMPRSAIDAGLADVVAPVEELPGRIFSYRDHAAFMGGTTEARQIDAAAAIEKICVLLREYSGNDFTLYKRSTIYRRIERRMGLHQIDGFPSYLRLLRENPRELELLFEELLIGVTSFFRDPGEWERLRQDVLPALVSSRAAGGVIRAWVPGCSTGEEAYSLAMILKEALEPIKSLRNVQIQIFATDLDRNAIERARIGLYPENIAADVSPERLRRFFVHEERGYRVSKDVRETVVFAPQNVIMDPPFTKVDILSCRNLLIYLSSDVQKKLIPLFHYCVNPGGVLFLGTAETVGTFTNLFTPLDSRTRIYRRLDQSVVTLPIELGFAFGRQLLREDREEVPPTRPVGANIQILVDRLIVQRYAPLGILCNTKGDVLYVSGRAGKFLEPAIGKPNLSVFAMAREGLRYELSTAFAKAVRGDRPVTVNGIKVGTNGGMQTANVTVQKLIEPKELQNTVIVVISEVATPTLTRPTKGKRQLPSRAAELADELQKSREEVQTIREEMQTSQEELKSANEELQSTNEELQSTNEELTTSKEEMQSLNEELQTVNHELQAKVDELSRSNNDMKNLLNSTDIATLFLDADLRVRRFTTATSKIIKLIPADIGRPVTDLASDLDYTDLPEDAREVLRTLIYKERQAATRDGRAFTVRILPYRTLENVIDGVVITFTDASAARALELAAREQTSQLRQMAESLPILVWGARGDGAFDYISKQWLDYSGVPEPEQARWGWLEQVHAGDRDRVREEWRAAVKTGNNFDSEFRIRGSNGTYRWFKTRGTAIRDTHHVIVKWYGTSTEIDRLKRAEDRLGDVLASCSDAVIELDKDLVVITANRTAEQLTGKPVKDLVGKRLLEILPAARALEHALRKPPGDGELQLDGHHHHVQIQRDRDDGLRVFVRPGERA